MKLLVLASRFPYPLEKGDKLRIYQQIKGLSRQHSIVLVALTDKGLSTEQIAQLDKYCTKIYTFRLHKVGIYLRLIWWFMNGRSLQVGYFTSPILKYKINRIIERERPDHIYCQLVRMAEYAKPVYHIAKTLDYMDAFSKGMERQAESSPWYLKWIYQAESKRLREYEARIFYEFDSHTIISVQDRNAIANPQANTIEVVPNGVDVQAFWYASQPKPSYDVLFVGNMGYYPNVKAAQYLIEVLLPLLKQFKPNINICICGANPTQQVLALAQPGVQVLGWADDILAVYHSAKVFVAPLFHGSGLQNKILEAMAAGIPVVTTQLTNNAIGANENTEIVIANTADEFTQSILGLLSMDQAYHSLRSKARTFVQQNFSWDVFIHALDQTIIKHT
ncbi:MAG: glycosyltransferase [Bacteroidetes bacterium]|jgi:sugar transferase (PEP-CTERM/EpsH1 system associated)|nr:glycosyltransferase [Bacteroidota bacterium]